MAQTSQCNREGIKQQVKEAYGKVVYTYTANLKDANLKHSKSSVIKFAIIILSAVSTCGLLGIILQWAPIVLAAVTACITLANVILSSYSKAANLDGQELVHINTANRLWKIREKYLSLLTDYDNLSDEAVVKLRDELTEQTAEIYAVAPLTSSKAFKLAQVALKENEEQFFSQEELNKMLPEHLRTTLLK